MDAAILSRLHPDEVYERIFGEEPNFGYYHYSDEIVDKIDALVRKAIARGKPLTKKEIQSVNPDPLLQFDPEIRELVCL